MVAWFVCFSLTQNYWVHLAHLILRNRKGQIYLLDDLIFFRMLTGVVLFCPIFFMLFWDLFFFAVECIYISLLFEEAILCLVYT